MKGLTTRAVHCAAPKKDVHGALRMPVYDSVAFEFDTARDLELSFQGRKPAHAYSRITNPTVEDFEQRVRLIADALGVVATASGMGAISSVVMALGGSGSNVVTTRFLFGNTISLFEHTLKDWGLETRYVDFTNMAGVKAAIDSKTSMVFLEAITNPQLQVADIAAVTRVAGECNVPVVLDGTLTTPYLFNSRAGGVAIEVISSTKYMSGGATCVGGVIIDNGTFDWSLTPHFSDAASKFGPHAFLMRLRREVYRNFGTCLAPHNAYLQSLGLETMALRIERSCANALEIARHLSNHPKVRAVNYPGLQSSAYHAIATRQFGGRYGGLLTFDLQSKQECFRFMDSLTVLRRATNLNDNKTLIIHPASTIFCEYSPEERAKMGVGESMIRIATGIEDTEDLLEDIKQGLATL